MIEYGGSPAAKNLRDRSWPLDMQQYLLDNMIYVQGMGGRLASLDVGFPHLIFNLRPVSSLSS